MHYSILQATTADIPAIVNLLNATYRGEQSLRGWTSEANIIKGTVRTDSETIAQLMQADDSFFLKCQGENGDLTGCVHLRKTGDRMYLGMLSVLPEMQGHGIGKRFLQMAEVYAKKYNCRAIYMQVISIRTELNEWYQRNGYVFTGEKKPFEVDEKYGVPVMPLEFMILEKKMEE